jgi:hypothetical protein
VFRTKGDKEYTLKFDGKNFRKRPIKRVRMRYEEELELRMVGRQIDSSEIEDPRRSYCVLLPSPG